MMNILPKLFSSTVTIFTGEYGSGKTELAVNLARAFADSRYTVYLIDLDYVKPCFRLRSMRGTEAMKGVQIVAPEGSLENADMPILLPQAVALLSNPKDDERIIVDAAGDINGAINLAQFARIIPQEKAEVIIAVNPYRPFSSSPEKIADFIKEMSDKMRMPITASIANPYFSESMNHDDVERGMEIIRSGANRAGIPVRALMAPAYLCDAISADALGVPIISIERYMTAPWE